MKSNHKMLTCFVLSVGLLFGAGVANAHGGGGGGWHSGGYHNGVWNNGGWFGGGFAPVFFGAGFGPGLYATSGIVIDPQYGYLRNCEVSHKCYRNGNCVQKEVCY